MREIQNGCVGRLCEANPLFQVACGYHVNLLLYPADRELLDCERPG